MPHIAWHEISVIRVWVHQNSCSLASNLDSVETEPTFLQKSMNQLNTRRQMADTKQVPFGRPVNMCITCPIKPDARVLCSLYSGTQKLGSMASGSAEFK